MEIPYNSLLAIALSIGLAGPAVGQTNSRCESIFRSSQTNPRLPSPGERARHLEREGAACMGTGTYDVWVGAEYLDAGDEGNAIRVAKNALNKTHNARPNLMQVLAQADLNRGAGMQALQRAEEIAAAYPNYAPIQYFLAEMATRRQDWPRALKFAGRAYEIEGSAIALLSMASALHQLDRHEETVDVVRRALAKEPQRIAKVTGILEAIFSLAILNRRAEAAELARQHIAANANWRSNRMFAKAAHELGVADR